MRNTAVKTKILANRKKIHNSLFEKYLRGDPKIMFKYEMHASKCVATSAEAEGATHLVTHN